MVQFPLAGLTIAVTGDFGPRRSHDTIRRWVEKNGGQWATKVSNEVTHLISTKEDYRSKAPMGNHQPSVTTISALTVHSVKTALKLKLLNIMTFDWLEGKSRLPPIGCYRHDTEPCERRRFSHETLPTGSPRRLPRRTRNQGRKKGQEGKEADEKGDDQERR